MTKKFHYIFLALPLAWGFLFSLPEIRALLVTGILFVCAGKWRFPGAAAALSAVFILIAYLPITQGGRWVFVIWPLAGLIAITLSLSLRKTKNQTPGWSNLIPFSFVPLTVFLFGGGLVLLFSLSPVQVPRTFLPIGGLAVAGGCSVVWLLLVHSFLSAGESEFSASPKLTIGLPLLLGIFAMAPVLLKGIPNDESALSDWEESIETADRFESEVYSGYLRKKALASAAVQDYPAAWVRFAKGTIGDPIVTEHTPNEYWRLLAKGGEIAGDDSASSATPNLCVGLEIDFKRKSIWTLTSQGTLTRIGEQKDSFLIERDQTYFVDCDLHPEGKGIYLLENCGYVALFDGTSTQTICRDVCDPSRQVFRRLKIDPTTGEPWAMDLYGALYRSPSLEGWQKDTRFTRVCRRGEIDYDIARDFCFGEDGTVALLLCDGEIWTSSKESSEISGPERATHYYPDFPVGQSIKSKQEGYSLVDRYGGFFHSPYPDRWSDQQFRGTYLFPRGVYLKEDRVSDGDFVVDHEYDEENRWLFLLTTKGELLTNRKWDGIWAD